MLFRSTVLIFMSVVLMSFGSVAHAETTEWFSGKDRRSIAKQLRGKLLTKIDCRDTGGVDLNVADFEYRATFTDNPKNMMYRWAIGSHYGPAKAKSERDGYKLVSYESFRRKKSGLKIHCAVWHKQ